MTSAGVQEALGLVHSGVGDVGQLVCDLGLPHALADGVLNDEAVVHGDAEVHHDQEKDEHYRQEERKLDECLASLPASGLIALNAPRADAAAAGHGHGR